jgi:DNA-binding MarR family transcriptional regulator
MLNEALPDCMMPDGAQPCVGFSQLEDKTRAATAILGDHRLLLNAKLAAIALIMHGGRLTRVEIAQRIRAHDRTMTRIMGRLVDLGLVDEARDGMTSAKSYRWKGATT